MHITLQGDSLGRVVGTIEHNGEHATVTGSEAGPAITDLRLAVESAVTDGLGECFWHEATGEYRWLFRREGGRMRIAILYSMGTLTGWEHRFWAECDAGDFRDSMRAAIS
jgi:hypothetical protein